VTGPPQPGMPLPPGFIPLHEYRDRVRPEALTPQQRLALVDQAELLLESMYVHLPHKRAMHAVEPLQRLRLLRHRLPGMGEAHLHTELAAILVGLRDLHTLYVLPTRYQGFALLGGILIERFVEDGRARYVLSKHDEGLFADPNLVVGAEITYWNGSPIDIAVHRFADREAAGSNPAARLASGLAAMTMRPIALSLPPDEDWVVLTYRAGGRTCESRIPWIVADPALAEPEPERGPNAAPAALIGLRQPVGMDVRGELSRRMRERLFAGWTGPARRARMRDEEIPTYRGEFRARALRTPHATFGHLRIFTFFAAPGADGDPLAAITEFVAEAARLLGQLPQDGLVLDIRTNPGGYITAAESLLQFFSPRPVRPQPFQFLSSRTTAAFCRDTEGFAPWLPSIEESTQTGAHHSVALPFTPDEWANGTGQIYHGPVVLVTDALCYSAADIFAAGFQDHRLGTVLGVDARTGAGGAAVFAHSELSAGWPGGPLEPLPDGADLTLSLLRCLRVGERFGQPVEDLGVTPDVVRPLTRRDLLEDNADLLEHAAGLLAGCRPRRLVVHAGPIGPDGLDLRIETRALTSLDLYIDGRPAGTAAVRDGAHTVALRQPAAHGVLRVEGFDGAALVASRLLTLGGTGDAGVPG
jgi:Peptidase family S41